MIHVLDTLQLGRPGIIAATAVPTSDGVALFDTGPESTFDDVAAGLRAIGAQPRDVRHVFLSHIHFDHAGAAWRFAELGATVYVHPRGAPHLLDPAKLVESATRIFGDQMGKLWGRFAPIAEERLGVLEDGDVVEAGGLRVGAIETPGHASHHHVYTWEDNLFGGDVAGVRLGSGPAIPPFVPPELHIESWLGSIEKMRRTNAENLYLPHFGQVSGTLAAHLDQLEQCVREWSAWFRERLHASDDDARLTTAFAEYEHAHLREHGATEALIGDYEAADPSYMAVTAAARYWRKFHPEATASAPAAET